MTVGEFNPVTLGKGGAAGSVVLVTTSSDRQTPRPETTLSQFAATQVPPFKTFEELEQAKQFEEPASEQLEQVSSHF